jgi:hypothetical protein
VNYDEFIKQKIALNYSHGHKCRSDLSSTFHYQKPCIEWACEKGRAALFQDTGLGKTLQQLLWSDSVVKETGGNVLILAPLSVTNQTSREGIKFGVNTSVCTTMADVKPGINITNYEKLSHFDCSKFDVDTIPENRQAIHL